MERTILSEVETLVRRAGREILRARDIEDTVDAKSGRQNYVTEYDKKVQALLADGLGRILPEAVFLGEEGSGKTDVSRGYAWIVDPIDGTTNFIKGLAFSAVSVGLVKDGTPVLGAVYNPYADEMFTALEGGGARLNGNAIHVSGHTLEEGVVLFGTSPYYAEMEDATFAMARHYFDRCIDIRRSGSAALDLCSVAAGRAELYVEMKVSPWDCAAGILLVREAGGSVTDMAGEEISCVSHTSIKAGNAVVMEAEATDPFRAVSGV